MREFTEQELVRREKAENLRALGLDPFGHRFDVTSNSKKIKENFENCSKEDLEEAKNEVVIAGRMGVGPVIGHVEADGLNPFLIRLVNIFIGFIFHF